MSIAACLDSVINGDRGWKGDRTIQAIYERRADASKARLTKFNIVFGFFCIEDPTSWT